ncbi:MAG: PAS domain-containing protein [Rubrivivax sp.]|nr:PAS domain-containing protein [Rubrivivax sp.]
MADHEQTEKVIDALETLWRDKAPEPATVKKAVQYFSEFADACHNQKEEQHLFPRLSAAGIPSHGGPLGMMLMEHERSKQLLDAFSSLGQRVVAGDAAAAGEMVTVFLEYGALLKNHYWKENDILYPMGRRALGPDDDAAIVKGILEIENGLGADTRNKYQALAQEMTRGTLEDLSAPLDKSVIAAILNSLPIELSFVDADDCVRYFSHENHAKLFPRTRGVIGLKVQNCHPPKSVHMVEQILADFKAGRRESADFWIDMGSKKIHIRYFAVRAAQGEYLGCLETVQDITAIQQLTGQKRLLD